MVTAGSGYVVGIDLGTTFTAAAVASEGRADIVSLGHTAAVVPSVVLVRDDGEVLVGEAAERRAGAEPTRVGREFKRRLGDPVPLVLGGTPYGAEALTAYLLRSVYDRVVEQQGAPPEAVVITHPANYGEYKLDLVREAVRLADVPNVQFLTEPEAAATHYGEQDRLEPGDVVAVYDFGGGTFDAAVLRVGAGEVGGGDGSVGFGILGTPEGMDRLGGIDFDQAVYAHVMTMLGEAVEDLDPAAPATASALADLREECREAKEALSSDTDVDVPVRLPNLHTDVRITRTEFEAMIRPRIAETIESLNRAIRSAGLEPDQITKVLLVGGSSRIPLVAEMVGAATGRPVALDAHPKHAIAAGAALHAWRGLEPAPAPLAPPSAAAAGVAATAAAGSAGSSATDAGSAAADRAGATAAGAVGSSAAGAPPSTPTGDGSGNGDNTIGESDDGSSGKRRTMLIAGAVVGLVVIAIAAFALTSGGNDSDDTEDAAAAPTTDAIAAETTAPPTTAAPATTEPVDVIITEGEVILEPLTAEGDDPFTESVATEPSVEMLAFAEAGGRTDDATPPTTAGTDGGDTGGATVLVARLGTDPGLYGGTRDEGSCDPDLLVEVLGSRQPEAEAWAGVHEIEVDEIPEYVALLTPMVLTADTRVTNHGFVDGVAVPRQSVLQVGTAVLVDEFGAPRVRCSSGSPLLAPEAVQGTTSYTGQAWDTFTPTRIVAVAAAPDPLAEFVIFDVVAGDEFIRPVGSTGAADRAVLPGEVLAVGVFTSLPDYAGPFDVNEFRMIFRPEGGPVEGSFSYAITISGFTINGSGDLTGTYDAASGTMSGTGFGEVSGGGVAGGTGGGAWSASVNPAAGTVSGTAGDADGTATFELTFPPYTP